MKRNKKIFYALLCAFGFILALGAVGCGCNKKKTDNESSSSASLMGEDAGELKLNETSKEVIFGDAFQLNASGGTRDTSQYVWRSSDEKVLIVKDGYVEAVGCGKADITVSFGDQSATCSVNASFGDLQPNLYLNNIANDKLTLKKGDEYGVSCKVLFNGKFYPCEAKATVEDASVCSYANGTLSACEVGSTKLSVKGDWNGFENSFMQKEVLVTVLPDVDLYVEIQQGSETFVADAIDLSLVDSWAENTYFNTATLAAYAVVDGEKTPVELQVANGDVIDVVDGKVTAKNVGSTTVSATYVYEGSESVTFETSVDISVTCPIVSYDKQFRLCTSENFPTATLFGEDAEILSAKQGEKDLIVRNNSVQGIVPMGKDTESLEICTTAGGYSFSNVFAYTLELTKSNFMSVMKLQSNKTIEGYYILEEDIEVNATAQMPSADASYFAGTFDGQGHKLSATVGKGGVFGGLGDKAVVKNTHFEFTFDTTQETACGLGVNGGTYYTQKHTPKLENLYVTTTNYAANTFSLFYYRPVCLQMKSIYVQLNGVEEMEDYVNVEQTYGALFSYDANSITGPYGAFYDDFADVYVVSERFMPMANIKWDSGENVSQYVTYAKNDEGALGGESALLRDTSNAGEPNFCKVYPKDTSDEGKKLFGMVYWAGVPTWYAWLYESYVPNGGIARYDRIEDLNEAGITQIGTWAILAK